uniref:Uncharacterized protein LOC110210317 isoform X2 n=1 Tax=Phascolarctos cinereus TaxID=38626 RepID=A0A6P5KGV5_PHACI|nr:uncharacterized protein LOC110210317 isoform X2 [Phascolarctos cinereus]
MSSSPAAGGSSSSVLGSPPSFPLCHYVSAGVCGAEPGWSCAALGWAGLGRAGLGWAGLGCAGCSRLRWTVGLGWAEPGCGQRRGPPTPQPASPRLCAPGLRSESPPLPGWPAGQPLQGRGAGAAPPPADRSPWMCLSVEEAAAAGAALEVREGARGLGRQRAAARLGIRLGPRLLRSCTGPGGGGGGSGGRGRSNSGLVFLNASEETESAALTLCSLRMSQEIHILQEVKLRPS